ncbi:hypothetical protein V0R50_14260 [Pseudomonas sp. 148P]|uniref:Uncharacterized protein n=1 Tax=Pseudomonas ulcerans TaxID=3115852 RepID=A0ABU7HS73_9PSED|nr:MULTISPECIES: hypothetical protein [unclassified Pseudomonas]MEE1923420.1 hypothetical protein [Pseudomonas sp. 147P]MEE1934392.1 hypothetical protein [Pseudomonas sp. 148P]
MADYLKALASNLSVAGTVSNVTNKTNVASDPSAVPDGQVRGDMSKLRSEGAPAATKSSTEDSGESQEIKQLREQVKKLQQQLAEQQKQLQAAMASKEDEQKAVRVAAAQAAVATVTGQLLQATSALLQALTEAGSSSAGNSVSTTA